MLLAAINALKGKKPVPATGAKFISWRYSPGFIDQIPASGVRGTSSVNPATPHMTAANAKKSPNRTGAARATPAQQPIETWVVPVFTNRTTSRGVPGFSSILISSRSGLPSLLNMPRK